MFAARKSAMLIVSVFAFLAFCWQANACFAEHAGIIPTHQQGSESTPSNDIDEGHCCHTESAPLTEGHAVGSMNFRETCYQSRAFAAPDGPIKEIEYPPQIQS